MPLTHKYIYIISSVGMQSELLVYYLQEHTGVTCTCDKCLGDIVGALEPERQEENIIMLDCFEKRIKDQIAELQSIDPDIFSKSYLCLFNVPDNGPDVAKAVGFGVRGVFYENDPLERILKGIEFIFRGQFWIARGIMEKCISMMHSRGVKQSKMAAATDILTRREKEILSFLATGHTNEEIAKKLFISQHTVKTHIFNVYKKLEVSNRLQASLWAAKHL